MKHVLTAFALSVTLASSISLEAADLTRKESEFFEKKIRPLLAKHCYKCHASKTGKSKGGLVLDSADGWMNGGDSGPAIEPGNPAKSILIRAVQYKDPDIEMPPKSKLSDEETRVLVQWVRMGAPDPRQSDAPAPATTSIDIEEGKKFWSFQTPTKQEVPSVENDLWAIDSLDRFILARLESEKLKPSEDADRTTFIRRVTFDLTGLPPTPEEVKAFVESESSRAYEELVDRLIGSQQFGEHWGRHWLDIARYAESTGKTRNYPYSHAWRYRDYVIDAFNADIPYDRFVTEQVAGDILAKDASSPAEIDRLRTATAFLALGPKDLNERNKVQYQMDNVDEQIDVTTRAVLGLTVSCARCHDHKFDPIPTRDYYALAGIFRSTNQLVGMGNKQGGGNKYKNGSLYPISDVKKNGGPKIAKADTEKDDKSGPNARQQRRTRQLEQQLAALRQEMQNLQREAQADRKRGKNRGKNKDRKGKKKKGKGKVQVLADVAAAPKGSGLTAQQRKARLRELRQEIKAVNQQVNRAKKRNQNRGGGARPKGPAIMGITEANRAQDCRILIRGEISNQGTSVPRGFLQVLSTGEAPKIPAEQSGRLQLASWLSSKSNPLTARVFVNRAWHHLFGSGLVETVDNFGATGKRPSHPELLDHLAIGFSENWSVKKLIRRLVLSRTYRMSSGYVEEGYAKDPDNKLIWRMNQRRIDVEALRDAMLAVSGQLDKSAVKGSIVQNLPVGEIGRNIDASRVSNDGVQRSVYIPVVRSVLPTMFETFDFADPSMVKGKRDITTVPTQALFLLNDSFVMKQASETAKALMADKSLSKSDRIEKAYRLAFSRSASDRESKRSSEYIDSFTKKTGKPFIAWASLCQALFASAEFRYLD